MRAVIPAVSLLIAAFSLGVDFAGPPPGSTVCRLGGCRFDQIFAAADAAGAGPEVFGALVAADPADPLVWCTYGDVLSYAGQKQQAESAFDHALSLGPAMAPVLMRAANFDFANGRRDQGFLLATQILSQTTAYDEVLFSYLQAADIPAGTVLGTAIPAAERPARAWLAWLRAHGSDEELYRTWDWMKRNSRLDETSAGQVAWTLWNRASYRTAYALWADWLGSAGGSAPRRQLLANTDFGNPPRESPFDWAFASPPSVAIARANGLEVRFAGTANVAFAHLRQFTVAVPGRYRFSAEMSSENLTTDQGLFFRIFDPADPARLSVETRPVAGTTARTWFSAEFTVARGTEALAIELERRPSQEFDNRISGILRIHQVSLVPISAPLE